MNKPKRTPTDGKPYYCKACDKGFYEYVNCERTDACQLEPLERAQERSLANLAPLNKVAA